MLLPEPLKTTAFSTREKCCFHSQRECSFMTHGYTPDQDAEHIQFQSQPRCRFLSHFAIPAWRGQAGNVSISTEMPLPEPLQHPFIIRVPYRSFNLNRDAAS